MRRAHSMVAYGAQPPAAHASQQLACAPTHPRPFLGALQCAASRRIAHVVAPAARVRQHVTNPGLPHVDLAAQRLTSPLHVLGRIPAATAALMTRVAHWTYSL